MTGKWNCNPLWDQGLSRAAEKGIPERLAEPWETRLISRRFRRCNMTFGVSGDCATDLLGNSCACFLMFSHEVDPDEAVSYICLRCLDIGYKAWHDYRTEKNSDVTKWTYFCFIILEAPPPPFFIIMSVCVWALLTLTFFFYSRMFPSFCIPRWLFTPISIF